MSDIACVSITTSSFVFFVLFRFDKCKDISFYPLSSYICFRVLKLFST